MRIFQVLRYSFMSKKSVVIWERNIQQLCCSGFYSAVKMAMKQEKEVMTLKGNILKQSWKRHIHQK